MKFEAILWDCDGCLIDSEFIACSLGAKLLTDAGYPISTENYIRRFCGQSKDHTFESIQQDCGIDYRPYMQTINKHELQREAFREGLKSIEGIEDTLAQINLPMAIASGSETDRLQYTLELTNLHDRFLPHIYSSSACVPNGKPAPDVFLYAADKLGIAPEKCLVIEDSLNGVRAGKAANMVVFGFTGGSHVVDKDAHKAELRELGADVVFDHMSELPELIRNFT